METFIRTIGMYFCAISLIGILITVYDKIASIHLKRHRVREDALMGVGILGGATLMYLTMLIIRHKTKHRNFMVGFPMMILCHVAIGFLFYYIFFR